MADNNPYGATQNYQGDEHSSSADSAPPSGDAPQDHPERIGRYRIEKVLGQGGFGLVYLAQDDQLQRQVAIKVPHARLVSRPEDAEAYLAEARTVANLDHPNIVPVHDVGSRDEFPCYVVSKYVQGTELSRLIKQNQFACNQAAELVATVAEALHYAHQRGLVHRDVKPGNILLDADGKPHVVDFGLALREQDLGRGPRYAGTPAYMSPEQARGEGHRVDGRSDIFSLGVVFYELLVGRRPFRGETQKELLEQVTSLDARPPRQIDDRIPRELERICLKTLSKRATERYTTCKDLADDLRHFLVDATTSIVTRKLASETQVVSDTPSLTAASESLPSTIVPKGLRSFDEHDADFFLQLLPDPRDRDGLPDSLRFWKTRIEETDPDNTFSVGLIYGPSGCGKSSLVKAGLLPRLCEDVIPVYVEATPDETEARLLRGLRKQCPALDDLSLKEILAALRKGQGIPVGQKVLIVLDQFEQWLHTRKEGQNTELVQALRQCDGERVQCVVMVRDDFWLAVSRFMHDMEVRLLEAQNSALVDLFDVDHARRVLAAFGRAFGRLPDVTGETSDEQNAFLKEAAAGLAEGNKVICVRLAVLAEMMKGRSWTPAALQEVGGTTGVGATFLEESFTASTAPPAHRYHQKAARAVLKALLPESGADIKGHMRSHDELLEASGYARRPKDFEDLIRILDSEIRLITPADPEGVEADDDSVTHAEAGQKYFQLTHDYLVHSLRDWLTRKQKETRRGRAELRLAERSALWNAKPVNRHLPAWWEYINIRLFTDTKQWAQPQRKMMRKAGRVHGLRWGMALILLLAVGLATQRFVASQREYVVQQQLANDRKRAESLVGAVLTAPAEAVPYAIRNLEPLQEHAVSILQQKMSDEDTDGRQRLRAACALSAFGQVEHELLVYCVADASFGGCANIVLALRPAKDAAIQSLRRQSNQAKAAKDWRLKSRLAIVALHLGDASLARNMCQLRPDPIQRTIFIDTFPQWHGNVVDLAKLTKRIDDGALRSSICLGVGSIPVEELSAEEIQTWKAVLTDWWQSASDTATHSAAGWTLRNWQVELLAIPATGHTQGRDWHVNTVGMTMLKIPGGSFTRTPIAPDPDDSSKKVKKQTVTLTRSFLLADCEVSVGQFQAFIKDSKCPETEKPKAWQGANSQISPTEQHPVQLVSWYDAVLFCNWLSRQENLTACYKRTGEKEKYDIVEYDAWRLNTNADGYRLPTEAEWEYACRARTTKNYACGNDDQLLEEYAVFQVSKTETCGSKLPNAWGLFDVHGNVNEWCHDWRNVEYPKYPAGGDVRDPYGASGGRIRVHRGGNWRDRLRNCRSQHRAQNRPSLRVNLVGFRVARVPSASQASPAGSGAESGSR